mmetsp:Transcript_19713/g.54162  ORF Transcript_19713/g.54162 Transcript_19713/m.54162 type:complete len:114 (+) Transcript_19713:2527-2868(+)
MLSAMLSECPRNNLHGRPWSNADIPEKATVRQEFVFEKKTHAQRTVAADVHPTDFCLNGPPQVGNTGFRILCARLRSPSDDACTSTFMAPGKATRYHTPPADSEEGFLMSHES